MSVLDHRFADFMARNERTIKVELVETQGSSPREAGTVMFVSRDGLNGTIGGGQLEFMVVERAREMLASGVLADNMDIPLGPEIGQCCGGRVKVRLARMSGRDRDNACEQYAQAASELPQVFVLGSGHVGRALADLFQHLPVRCILVDSRESELAQCIANVETRLSAIPEVDILNAPVGSAFIVATHDHGLDFLLTSTALERGDATYVGMIGSATKRAKFAGWCSEMCDGLTIEDLICPIGASGNRDKRPSVIAAYVVAEVIAEMTSKTAAIDLNQKTDLRDSKHATERKGERAGKRFALSRSTGGGSHHG